MSNTRSTTPPKGRATPARPSRAKAADPVITFKGKEYRVSDKIGIWPLMQAARAAESGTSLADQRGLAAAHALLQDVIHPDDWGEFQEDMIAGKVQDLDELMKATQAATNVLLDRMAAKNAPRNGRRPPAAETEDSA